MKFKEILPALREGKKIKRKDIVWENYFGFLSISKTEEDEIFLDSVRDYYEITKEDLKADDWEVVK